MSVIPFRHPSTIVIAGPTQSGKTQFVVRLLRHRHQLLDPSPTRIVFVYGEKQEANKLIRDLVPQAQFATHFDSELYRTIDGREPTLLILDDQMDEMGNDPILKRLFTRGSHHRNMTIIYIVQNLFDQGKSMVTVGRNAHYKVLFKNPNDERQIITLASSMMPGNSGYLVDSFHHATRDPFGYLVIDNTQQTPDEFRLRTLIFPDEQGKVYAPEDYINEEDEEDNPEPE